MEKTTKTPPVKNVDEYISSSPANFREILKNLRATIKNAAPAAEELISYQIPTYKQNGALVHFAAFSDHCSFVIINKEILKELKQVLNGFKISGTTIHFTPEKPIPESVVKKIMEMRIEQNEKRRTTK